MAVKIFLNNAQYASKQKIFPENFKVPIDTLDFRKLIKYI